MNDRLRSIALSLAIVLIVLFSAVGVDPVRADDGAPPPSPEGGQSVDAAETTYTSADTTTPTDAPATDLAAGDGVTPDVAAAVDEVPPEAVSDVVQALADTGAVLVDGQGNSIPLTTPEAAAALAGADPWFDAGGGVIVGYSASGVCSAGVTECHTSATPMQDAINAAPAGVTVFVEAGSYNEDVAIDKALILTGLGGMALANSFTLNSGADVTGSTNVFAPIIYVMDGAKIQNGIDLASPGGTVNVYPGNYDEKATGRAVLGLGSYQFGLFIDKDNLTVRGVDHSGVPLIDHNSALLPYVTTNATNNFGYSGIFIQGDSVTLSGLKIGPNAPSDGKTIEVIGDDFSLLNSNLAVPGGSLYFNDWRFDVGANESYVQSYTVQGNLFDFGTSLALSSGAGFSGPVSGRLITGNVFNNSYNWPSISFNGSDTGVPWFTYSVGGAVISDNTFNNTYNTPDDTSGYIRARGTYDNSQFDWASYWGTNIFTNGAVIDTTDGLPGHLQTYSYPGSYGTYNNVRRIGTSIQGEINHAQSGDTVLVAPGTYEENLIIDTSLTLRSVAGAASTFIDASTTGNPYVVFIQAPNVTLDGFDISSPGYVGGSDASGVVVEPMPYGPGAGIRITNNIIHDIGTPGRPHVAYGNVGINIGMADGVEVDHNEIYNILHSDPNAWANGISIWGGGPGTPSDNIFIHDNFFHDISSPYPADAAISTQTDVGDHVTVHDNSLISTIAHPTEFGVEVRGFNIVDALHNWWGDASGPFDNSPVADDCGLGLDNPSGTGSSVTPCVIYENWLTADPFAPVENEPGGDGGGDRDPSHPRAVLTAVCQR